MDSIIEFPKCYYVSEANVDSVLASDKTSVIYYKRSGCGDCTYLEPNILKPYIESHESMNNLYVLDCEDWLTLENKGQANKDKYGLSNVNNPIYGYNSGYYPYFSLVENGQFKSGAEAFNVTIENKVITDSYYSLERADKLQYLTNVNTKVLTGLELSDADISSYWNYYQWWWSTWYSYSLNKDEAISQWFVAQNWFNWHQWEEATKEITNRQNDNICANNEYIPSESDWGAVLNILTKAGYSKSEIAEQLKIPYAWFLEWVDVSIVSTGRYASLWSATQLESDSAFYFYIDDKYGRVDFNARDKWFPVRCFVNK